MGVVKIIGSTTMSVREIMGLVFLIVGTAIVPIGWIVSHKILLIAGLFLGVGVWFFYTARVLKREERLAKDSTNSGNDERSVSGDVHNYTGWRTGGRTSPLDSTSSDGDADGD